MYLVFFIYSSVHHFGALRFLFGLVWFVVLTNEVGLEKIKTLTETHN